MNCAFSATLDAKLRDRPRPGSSAWFNRRRSHVLGEPAEQPFRILTEMVVSVEKRWLIPLSSQFLFVSTQGIEDGLTVGLSVDRKSRQSCAIIVGTLT